MGVNDLEKNFPNKTFFQLINSSSNVLEDYVKVFSTKNKPVAKYPLQYLNSLIIQNIRNCNIYIFIHIEIFRYILCSKFEKIFLTRLYKLLKM